MPGMSPWPHRQRAFRRGAAAAELALLLPPLLSVVLGCVDFGRFAYTYISVTNAARAGASYAIMNNFSASTSVTWNNNVVASAQAESSLSGVTVPSPTVTTDANGLKRVRVSASYQFSTLMPWPGLPNAMTVGRTVEMRLIR